MAKQKLLLFSWIFIISICFTIAMDGNGSIDNPYQVSTCADLRSLNSYQGSYSELINDIDCSGYGYFTPLGDYWDGFIEGNGYEIHDINIRSDYLIGIIGRADSSAMLSVNNLSVRNCHLSSTTSYGTQYHGCIVGYVSNPNAKFSHINIYNVDFTSSYSNPEIGGAFGHFRSKANNIYVNNMSVLSAVIGAYCGGVAGRMQGGTINDSMVNNFKTSACWYVGGVIGYGTGEIISRTGAMNINLSATLSGGFIGYQYRASTIKDTYVQGVASNGGYIGYTSQTNQGYGTSITNSYSSVLVTSGSNNGFSAYELDTSTGTYWDIGVSGQNSSVAGEGLTTSEMLTEGAYIGWDFTSTWGINESKTYPYLLSVPLLYQFPQNIINIISVSITNPFNNTYTNQQMNVTYNMSNNYENINTSCRLYVDGSLDSTQNFIAGFSETKIFPVVWAEGLHDYFVNCSTDQAEATSGEYMYYLDYTEPYIQSVSPSIFNITTFENYTMRIEGNATNLDLQNVTLTILYPNSTLFYYNETTSFDDSTKHLWDYLFSTSYTDNGEWTMIITAKDMVNTNTKHYSFIVDNCVPDWSCVGFSACNESNSQLCNNVSDNNACGLPYSGDYSEFGDFVCDFCQPSAEIYNVTECISKEMTTCYYDTNFASCCNITGIESDCPYNDSIVCTTGVCTSFDYEADDLPIVIYDLFTRIFLVIATLIVVFVIVWFINVAFTGRWWF